MSTADISAHLLADWMPWLPPSASTSFMGWPPFLIEVLTLSGNDCLALREEAARTEAMFAIAPETLILAASAEVPLVDQGKALVNSCPGG